MRRLRRGDVLLIRATDHNNGGGSEVVFLGAFVGRVVEDHRRFLRLASVYYPEGDGFIGIGKEAHVVERNIVHIRNLGSINGSRRTRR